MRPRRQRAGVRGGAAVRVGRLFGLEIGQVSGLLGFAAGELLIPTLAFEFGTDVKTAATACLLVSLPATAAVGVVRDARRGAFDRAVLPDTVAPMGAGSVIGALSGGVQVVTRSS